MTDDRNKLDRPHPTDESLLIRPSGAPALTSLDQLAYNNGPGGYGSGPMGEGFNVREFWRKIRKRKWLVLTIVFIATTIVSIESFRTKSIYQATAKIQVNKDGSVIKVDDVNLIKEDGDRIKDELLLLQTYPFLENVVARLRLDRNPKFLEVGGRKTVLEAIQTIFSKFGRSSDLTPLPTLVQPLVADPGSAGGMSRTPEESERLKPYVGILQGFLSVDQIPETRAIEIRFAHTDPSIATAVANGVANYFIDYSFQNKNASFNKSTDFLESTTRKLEAQVQRAEAELQSYSANNNILTPGGGGDSLTGGKLADLYKKAIEKENDRILKESVYKQVKEGRIQQLPEIFRDPRTAQYQIELSKLLVKKAELGGSFGEDNPKIKTINQQIAEVQTLIANSTKSLEEQMKADYERSAREERLIKESLQKATGETISEGQASIRLRILQENVEIAKALYKDFLLKTNQVNIGRVDNVNNLRVIEPARLPTSPIGPRRFRSIMIGLFLSLVAGVGLALLIEYFDNTVKSIEDVLRTVQLPTLAMIPSMNAQSMRVLSAKKKAEIRQMKQKPSTSEKLAEIAGLAPRGLQSPGNKLATLDGLSSVVEAYRMLRTSVLLSTAGKPPRTILVTSSQPGEGKTTTAVNTAISLAQLGAAVLLIDADLRRPAVHKTFKLPHTRGLSNYLSGSGRLEDMIIKLPIPNLSVLTCGPIPPNPAELISSDRMKDLLRTLSEKYEHIIIDSPPLISVTDPVILSTMVDGSILVVQAGRSTRDMVRRSRQELTGVGAKIFGVVLNNVDVKREGYDEYYYQRYYSKYGEQQKGVGAG